MDKLNLEEHRKLVFQRMKRAKIPFDLFEDDFQEFAVYFYKSYKYDDKYKPSTYIVLKFNNWLSERASKWKAWDREYERDDEEIDSKQPDWLDWTSLRGEGDYKENTEQENTILVEQLLAQLQPLTVEYLMEKAGATAKKSSTPGDSLVKNLAKEQGVTRQCLEKRIKKDLQELLDKQ